MTTTRHVVADMSEWMWVALIIYGVVGTVWFLFCTLGWWVDREYQPEAAREAAWYAVRAPLWPYYGLRIVSSIIAGMAIDAVRHESQSSRRGGNDE